MTRRSDALEKLRALEADASRAQDAHSRILRKLEKWRVRFHESRAVLQEAHLQVSRQRAHVATIKDYPEEPTRDGTVVRFQKSYRGNTTVYSFAAVRGGDRWWVTGDSPKTRHGITWEQLCDFARTNNTLLDPKPIEQVDADKALEPPF